MKFLVLILLGIAGLAWGAQPSENPKCDLKAEIFLNGAVSTTDYELNTGLSQTTDTYKLKAGGLFILDSFEVGPVGYYRSLKQDKFDGTDLEYSSWGLGLRGKYNFLDIQKDLIVPYIVAELSWGGNDLNQNEYDRQQQQVLGGLGIQFFLSQKVAFNAEVNHSKSWLREWNSDSFSRDHNVLSKTELALGISTFL